MNEEKGRFKWRRDLDPDYLVVTPKEKNDRAVEHSKFFSSGGPVYGLSIAILSFVITGIFCGWRPEVVEPAGCSVLAVLLLGAMWFRILCWQEGKTIRRERATAHDRSLGIIVRKGKNSVFIKDLTDDDLVDLTIAFCAQIRKCEAAFQKKAEKQSRKRVTNASVAYAKQLVDLHQTDWHRNFLGDGRNLHSEIRRRLGMAEPEGNPPPGIPNTVFIGLMCGALEEAGANPLAESAMYLEDLVRKLKRP
jgi:hypothetical protein